MKVSVVNTRQECIQKVQEEFDIIVLTELLVGVFVFTTNREAMEAVYLIYKWSEAELADISRFYFPDMVKSQLIELLQDNIQEVELLEALR